MRKLLAVLFLFCSAIVYGQVVPQGINYQAVALDQQGQPIPGVDIVGRPIDDAEIGVRISILEASPTGNVLYQEEHEVLTDQYGMFNLTIGQGLQVSADAFNAINWQGDKFLQVELSIENNGSFTLSAVQQLMSVPYAFLADRALNVDDADADPTNELQALSISNDTLYLSSGGYVVLPSDQINDADADPTNELQAISMSNDTLYLSSGGFIVLPPDQINDADADPTNEFQTITRNGSTINLSGNGGSVTVFDGDYTNLTNTPTIPSKTSDLVNDSGFLTSEVDGSTTNEIQMLSKSGSTISLSDNGGSVTVFDGDYNNLSNTPSIPTNTSDLTNDSGFLTSEVDGSTTNEIQTLSKSGSTISLSDNGGSVTVFDGDYNNLSNSPSIPTNTSDLTNDSGFLTSEVDGSTTNEIQILSISNDTIFLSDGGFIKLPASQGFDGDYNSLTNTPSIPTNTSDLTNDSGFLTSEVDGSTTNELQVLSISNDTIFLSDGGFIKLPASQGFDGDYNSLTNTPSIPTLTSDLINDSGFLTSEVDGSTTNEIQTLSKSGSTISLSDNGGSVTVFDGDYNNLSNTPAIPASTSDLVNDSGFITTEQDSSTTNELQMLSISNDTIFLTEGGFVKLPSSLSSSSSSSESYRTVMDEASGTLTIPTGTTDSVTTTLSSPSSTLIVKTWPGGSNLQYNTLVSSIRLFNAIGSPVEFYFEETFYRKSVSSNSNHTHDDQVNIYYGNKTGSLPTISRDFDLGNNESPSTVRYSQVKLICKEPVTSCRVLFYNYNQNSNYVNSITGSYEIQTISETTASASQTSSTSSIQNNFQGNYLQQHGLVSTSSLDTLEWIVPNGISQIQLIHFGSNGGASGQYCVSTPPNGCSWSSSNGPGGDGMDVSFKFNVNPGDTITIYNAADGEDLPNGYKSGGTVGNNGGISQIFVNNQLFIYSIGGYGGIRGTAPCSSCAPGSGVKGENGEIFFYGDSSSGISAGSINNSFNGGLNNYGLIDFEANTNLSVRNLTGKSSETFIAY